MEIVLWQGSPFATPHEEDAREVLLRLIRQNSEASDGTLHLAFSFLVPGAEIDVVAFGSGGVLVGEMKEWPGRVRGAMNGPWTVSLDDGSAFYTGEAENPHAQCRRIRSRLAAHLGKHMEKSQRRGGAAGLPWKSKDWSARIRCGIVQFPKARAELSDGLSMPWWFLAGPEEWAVQATALTARGKGLPPDEAARLLAGLGLQRAPERLVAAKPVPKEDPASLRVQEQEAAVRAPSKRHLRIIAGPGAGKTRVLVGRLLHLVESGVAPENIALLTYTNSARREMQTRLFTKLRDRHETAEDGHPVIGTIHHFCLRLIRAHHEEAGMPARVRVLSSEAAERAFQPHLPKGTRTSAYHDLVLALNRWHGDGEPLIPSDLDGPHREFEATLQRRGQGTFESIQIWALDLIRRHPEVAPSHVLVDEFQDTTGLQTRVIAALVEAGSRISVVGDGEQSIFSFAGADPDVLDAFTQRFDGAEERILRCNSRSRRPIVSLASSLRRGHDGLAEQNALREGDEPPSLVRLRDEPHQAEFVASEILKLTGGGVGGRARSPGEIAVLCREGSPELVQRRLASAGIPWWQPGADRFEDRPHVRRVVAALEAIHDIDDEPAQAAVFELLSSGGGGTWGEISQCREAGATWEAAAQEASTRLDQERCGEVERYLSVREILTDLGKVHDPAVRVERIYARLVVPGFTLRERRRLREIEQDMAILAQLSEQYPKPGELAMAIRGGEVSELELPDAITVGTIHYAKGREWPVVFLVDFSEGVMPHRRSTYLEEERRILLVGVSRARDLLYLCAPRRVGARGRGASRFETEILRECAVRDLTVP